jgi:hypothetical protein
LLLELLDSDVTSSKKLSYSFGGGSNVDRWGLGLESDVGEMTHATLLATVRQFGLPLSSNPS